MRSAQAPALPTAQGWVAQPADVGDHWLAWRLVCR
jgi:hypothetical protein